MPGSYSTDLRERVLEAVEAGASPEAVAERFMVGRALVYRWVAAARDEGRRAPKPMIGGPKPVIRDETEAALRRLLAENNHLTLVECRDCLAEETGVRVDPCWGGRLLRHHVPKSGLSNCPIEEPLEEPSAMKLKRVAVDTSKSVFTVHAVDEQDRPVLRQNLSRVRFEKFVATLAPTEVVLEACGSSHHWGRFLQRLGHRVRLIPPQYVKPFVKRGKSDRNDAE